MNLLKIIEKSNAASSNGFCIIPRVNGPRSPSRFAEEQSEYCLAIWPNVAFPD